MGLKVVKQNKGMEPIIMAISFCSIITFDGDGTLAHHNRGDKGH
jgi:hypothetical protein